MIQSVQWWLGPEAELRSISYRHSSPAYAGDTPSCWGMVTAVDDAAGTFDVELWVRKAGGDGTDGDDGQPITTTSGTATFAIPADH